MKMRRKRETAPAAARIRKARRAMGWTQSKLGEAIGVSQQEIAKYESGERDPSAHMRDIAAALHRPLAYFYRPALVVKVVDNSCIVCERGFVGRPFAVVRSESGVVVPLDKQVMAVSESEAVVPLPVRVDRKGRPASLDAGRLSHAFLAGLANGLNGQPGGAGFKHNKEIAECFRSSRIMHLHGPLKLPPRSKG